MSPTPPHTVTPAELRLGLYIQLDTGWMDHPFPRGSFKITTQDQIDTLRRLGLERIRYLPEKSDPPDASASPPETPVTATAATVVSAPSPEALAREMRRQQLSAQRQYLARCERQFGEATRQYKLMLDELENRPAQARARCAEVIQGFVGEILGQEESAIRLLSEGMGDRAVLHSVNVTVLCLLLGKAMGLDSTDLSDLGTAALLHDIGKTRLPDRVRFREDHFTAAEFKLYQDHVAQGVDIAKAMELPLNALLGISLHHEMEDGSGFPLGQVQGKTTPISRILALVNRYDNLCNPGNASQALTPHEALSLIFAQMKPRFEATTLSAFIRMMGVYPPGSVVQLADMRYAMVVSVNSSRPLRPRVIVHDPAVPKDEALIVDLESTPDLSIKRSARPQQLPKSTVDYLSPRKRLCYFFDSAGSKSGFSDSSAAPL